MWVYICNHHAAHAPVTVGQFLEMRDANKYAPRDLFATYMQLSDGHVSLESVPKEADWFGGLSHPHHLRTRRATKKDPWSSVPCPLRGSSRARLRTFGW